MCPSNVRRDTHDVSPAWLPKRELNEDGINEHVKEGGGRAQEASALHKEVQATEESWEWEMWLSLGKNTPNGCPAPNGQP